MCIQTQQQVDDLLAISLEFVRFQKIIVNCVSIALSEYMFYDYQANFDYQDSKHKAQSCL